MLILGIETSCDDTGIAIVKVTPRKGGVKFDILSNIVSSQIKTHAPFGGVVPNLAAREHLKNIEPCLKTALREANKTMKDIDLIAATIGPGLIPSLLIGVNFAKALAYKFNIPIVGVNHLEGHIIAALAATNPKSEARNPKQLFPAIALVVSGGHTQLVLMNPAKKSSILNGARKIGQYKIIGETRDDAAGECFDKVAKLLGLGYPGGPVIAAQAAKLKFKSRKLKVNLPRPMIHHKNFDFSFSGLKTAVLYVVHPARPQSPSAPALAGPALKNKNFIRSLCRETQQAIIDVLIDKTFKAVEKYKAKTIILSGGVAANEELRRQFKLSARGGSAFGGKIDFLTPLKNLCMDNGAMIAMAGYYNRKKTCPAVAKRLGGIIANANLRIK